MCRIAIVLISTACVILLLARAYWVSAKVAAAIDTPQQAVPDASCHQDSILIGDSRIKRWPMHLFDGQPIVNKGLAGETTRQLTARFQRDVIACHPRFLLIETGINDLVAASLASSVQSRNIVRHLPELIIMLAEQAARGGSIVSIATIIPPARPDLLRRMAWSETIRDYVQHTNARLREHPWIDGVTLVDFASMLDAADSGRLPDGFRLDTLHLNATAYACLTSAIPFASQPPETSERNCINSLLPIETLEH